MAVRFLTKKCQNGVSIVDIIAKGKDRGSNVNLTIPEIIDGKKVISIEERAFVDIGDLEFDKTKGDYCNFERVGIKFNTVFVPGCIKIMKQSFAMAAVKKIVLGKGTTFIPESCFLNSAVEEIVFEDPEAIVEIGNAAFAGCEYLHCFQWPYNCKSISDGCFARSALTTISRMENVENIGNYAFSGTDIEEFILPRGCSYLPEYVFSGSKLKKIKFNASEMVVSSNSLSTSIEEVDATECASLSVFQSNKVSNKQPIFLFESNVVVKTGFDTQISVHKEGEECNV